VSAAQLANRIRPPEERLLLPWGLAAAAKVSLTSGNEHRASGVVYRDIEEICAAFNAIDDPLLSSPTAKNLGAFLLRISYEQFPYQLSRFEEVTRPTAMFSMDAAGVPTEVIGPRFWLDELGCSLEVFVGAGFLLSVAAEKNAGFFHLDVLDREDLQPAFEEVPVSTVQTVLESQFATSMSDFRRAAESHMSLDPLSRRYEFNSLSETPFIRWQERQFLAPATALVLMRVSTLGLYFMGLRSCGDDKKRRHAFTRDFGDLFEAYVGRQLAHLHDATVIPQIIYEGDQRSVDWFIVWPGCVVLVEAKSSRLTQESRMGQDALAGDIDAKLGKAFAQLKRSADLVKGKHPAFADIPSDRPILGMVVTLEPYFLVNSPLIRELLPDPSMPTLVVSARELEQLVAIGSSRSVEGLLRGIYSDPERSTWDLAQAIGDTDPSARNPILDEAWKHLPWQGRKDPKNSA
jgi:hypothetical protein